ncbi:hypothetical protein GIB67_004250 [Kingdonia uniflora]|uniref:BHLH domain-containing protein n=1 Tax=Kingdonia uniflora TaxID=39325 RepID=A0A7J7MRB1_9MAGN|nr:hypothetical protein GIB67_003934 [Kingdonia uniflora]KAF6157312.1 hypothetical protein GIB67_004250 [Kingdonia uniflora]
MINEDEHVFNSANTSSFSLAEIWPFPINGNGANIDESGVGVLSDCESEHLKVTMGSGEDFNKMPSGAAENVRMSELPEPKQDYIHVRARRGQATDSHSLAERARREKIGKRMKVLQDLVPGCNKIIGKALVLDEIINYIQSLQRQIEFLSMKLEVINSRLTNLGIEGYPSRDVSLNTLDT